MIRRALLFWCFMAVAMIVNGIVRETLMRPRMSALAAELFSAIIGITLIQLLARWAVQPLGATTKRDLLVSASIWLLLTLAFEFTFGHWVDHKSWADLFANYNIARGHLWPFGSVTMTMNASEL